MKIGTIISADGKAVQFAFICAAEDIDTFTASK